MDMAIGFPLILLMVFTGMAVGATILAAIVELIDAREKQNRFNDVARLGAYIALPTLLIGLAASMLHLANPFMFINGLLNFGSSWISAEGVFGILFLILLALYVLIWFMTKRGKSVATGLRVIIAVLAAVAAVCLIYSTGMVYVIVKPIPAWNTPLTLLFFIVSACTMGILLAGTALAVAGKFGKGEAKSEIWKGLLVLPRAALVLVLALIVVEALRLLHLSAAPSEVALQSLSMLGGPLLALSLLRWIVGLVLPAVLLLYACLSGEKAKQGTMSMLVIVSFICVLAGEIVSRALFFMTALHV